MMAMVGGLAACVAFQSVVTSVPYIEERSDWRVIADSTKLYNERYGVTLSITPLNARKEQVSDFFVHLSSFQKPMQSVKIDLKRIRLFYAGKIFTGEGWTCRYPVKTERTSRTDEYVSSVGCALISFPIKPPSIVANYSLSMEAVNVDGAIVQLPRIFFREGVVKFGGGFQ